MPPSLSILGASVRSAAQSARRSGFIPCGADLFADHDLQRACAATIRVSDYPHQLIDALKQLPSGPWMYTGGLENHPKIIDQIASTQTLLGNPGAVLCRVRDPWELSAVLTSHGLSSPAASIPVRPIRIPQTFFTSSSFPARRTAPFTAGISSLQVSSASRGNSQALPGLGRSDFNTQGLWAPSWRPPISPHNWLKSGTYWPAVFNSGDCLGST